MPPGFRYMQRRVLVCQLGNLNFQAVSQRSEFERPRLMPRGKPPSNGVTTIVALNIEERERGARENHSPYCEAIRYQFSI